MACGGRRAVSRPLLVIDGDSFAHRAYHALPKSIRRRGNRGAGAIVGFANFLLRLYESERPRAVLVGWDTLDVPTYRHRAFRGDPSDKLPGAKGVGPKGAASLLRKYGTLEEALANGRFAAQADELRLYRRIATMDQSAPLPALQDQTPSWAKASALAREWELNRLADRLDAVVEPQVGDLGHQRTAGKPPSMAFFGRCGEIVEARARRQHILSGGPH